MSDHSKLKELAEAATQGGWQVIETELPCRLGRPHVERRIFTTKDHPQLKAPYPVVNGTVALGTDETPVHHIVSMTAEDAAFIAASNPAAVLALIAEIQCLKIVEHAFTEWIEKTEWVQASVQPTELGRHRADVLRARIDNLKTENERLRKDRDGLLEAGAHLL